VLADGPAQPAPASDFSASTAATSRVIMRWSDFRVRPEAGRDRVAEIRAAGGQRARFVRLMGGGFSVFDLGQPLGKDAPRVLGSLRRLPGVLSAEPDSWVTLAADPCSTLTTPLPNDCYGAALWGLLGAANGSAYGIDAVSAWTSATGSDVVVAVVDTGLVSHPDLEGQSVPGANMVSVRTYTSDPKPRAGNGSDPGDWCPSLGQDSSWHGTHVAGTIAGLANNTIGVFGGAPDVKVQPVRVLGHCGGELSDVADGIRWAAGATDVKMADGLTNMAVNPTPARVINLSLGGSGSTCPTYLGSAINYALGQGSVVVAAAGNSAANAATFTPANCPGVLTVASTTQAGKRSSFSNYGSVVDIAAPGSGIISTIDSGATVSASPAYAYYSGTSMATPHVSLSAALLLSAQPSLTAADVAALLKGTATPFASSTSSTSCQLKGCGAGIVNIARALNALASGTVPDAPGNVTAAAGNKNAAISWQAPASNGGVAITSYTATADPGGATCTTTGALNCTIGGLTNGTAYTVTVSATNWFGAGAASDPSNSVTPFAPPAAKAASSAIVAPAIGSGKIIVRVSWPAATGGNGGIVAYQLQKKVNTNAWTTVTLASPAATSIDLKLGVGRTYRWRVRARDAAGTWSGWAASPAGVLKRVNATATKFSYKGTYKKVALSGAVGGTVVRVSSGRATISFKGTSWAFVTTRGSSFGIADLWLDGAKVQSVDTYAANLLTARLVYSGTVAAGTHTFQMRASGLRNASSTGARVDVDAFIFWKQ
jgi:serine protease